jgi:WD40 repeat protein
MGWPTSQDYNEAIQTPEVSFADAELRSGQAAVNALGIPQPRSGNFADVYEVATRSGTRWAVKCFTRDVPGLQQRYAEISRYLHELRLPFMVDFQFQTQGIRVRDRWYPLLKMRWVEGLLLNEFVRDHLDRPAVLEGLCSIWLRMAKRLREAGMAHADLQHGNVLLVPASRKAALALRLIDYDGTIVPALMGLPSGEVGHPAYQHPQRLRDNLYSSAVDRFPLLAVFCSLRALVIAGRSLWNEYDNGDNLLFRAQDFEGPAGSALFRRLWQIPDAALHTLVGYLAMSCLSPMEQVPLLEELVREDQVIPLHAAQEQWVIGLLGPGAQVNPAIPFARPVNVALPAQVQSAPPPALPPALTQAAAEPWAVALQEPTRVPRRRKARARRRLGLFVGVGLVALLGIGAATLLLGGGSASTTTGPGTGRPGEPHWVSLFNGKDLSGWKAHTKGASVWRVEKGVLLGEGRAGDNHLFSERGDYADFHFRFEARISKGGLHGQGFRARLGGPGLAEGYLTQSNGGHEAKEQTGSLFLIRKEQIGQVLLGGQILQAVQSAAVPADTWFTQEVIARGNHIVVQLDGKPVVDYIDPENSFRRGHFVLDAVLPQLAGSRIAFRKIEVKELPPRDLLGDGTYRGELLRLRGHEGEVLTVAFAPDGKSVASAGADRVVRLWSLTTGEEVRHFIGHTDAITSVGFSRDGEGLLSGSHDFSMRLWNVSDGAELKKFTVPGFWVNAVALSPDGKYALCGTDADQLAHLWELSGEAPAVSLGGHTGPVYSVAFSPDSRSALTAGSDGIIRLWDLATREEKRRFVGGHTNMIVSVAFGPGGEKIVSGSHDQTVRLWDAATGNRLGVFQVPGFWVKSVAFSPTGAHVLAGTDADKLVHLWDVAAQRELPPFAGHQGGVRSVAFSPDGRFAVSGAADGVVRVWGLGLPR